MNETALVDLYNAAITTAGGKGRLSSLLQKSKEREACDTWYPIIRNTIQAAAHWPASKTSSRLTKVAERDFQKPWNEGDPAHPYKYSYSLPSDYLHPWYLHDYAIFEMGFIISINETVIHTNTPQAVLTYARLNDNIPTWLPSQLQATIWALSAHIVSDISGKTGLRNSNLNYANEILMQAQSQAAGTHNKRVETMPPNLAARGTRPELPSRFYYQHGSLFHAGVGANV